MKNELLNQLTRRPLLLVAGLLTAAAPTQAQWVSYTDILTGPGTHVNATGISGTTGNALLKDIVTGASLPVTITVSNTAVGTAGTMATPAAGTPAANIFSPYIDWSTSPGDDAVYLNSAGDTFYITFSGLNPNALYNFAGSAVRGGNYVDRWTRVTLLGAESYIAAHQTGPGSQGIIDSNYASSGLSENEAAISTGHNVQSGDVVGWNDINPGADGEFTIVCIIYSGPYPPNDDPSDSTRAYGISAIRLEEVMRGPVVFVQQPTPATNNVEEFSSWSISVRTTGAAPRFQWYKGALGAGTPISGATSSSYGQTSASLSDSGTYYVIATNSESIVTSEVAQVTVFVNPIQITQQPTNRMTVVQLRPFTLSVTATGTRPQYQWYKGSGGVYNPITDATNRTYSVASADSSHSGDYIVIITNTLYNVTSTVAQVSVTTDVAAPRVLNVIGSATLNQFTIEFDEVLDAEIATDEFNYTFTPNLDVLDASLINNATTVILSTGPQTPGTAYNIALNALDFVRANTLNTNVTATAWVTNHSGGVLFEVYAGIGGTGVSNLTASPIFPNFPTEVYTLASFDTTTIWPDVSPNNTAANRQYYGARLRGWFIPPFSGQWRFFIASDDNSELWINTNGASADGRMLIANEPNYGATNSFREPGTNQTSAAFDLIAGKPYYLEALYKEGGGNDFCQVAARREGDPTVSTNLLPIVSGALGYPALPAGLVGQVSVILQPTNATVESPGAATFAVLGSNSINAPFTYQWQQDDGSGTFTNIPGAQLRTFTRQNLMMADSTSLRCIVASGDSVATSQVATLTVTRDATGPGLVTAIRALDVTNIVVTFSEPVLANEIATNTLNYQLCDAFNAANCIGVLSVVLTNNDTQALLQTDLPVADVVYRLTVNNVTDTNNNVVRLPNNVVVGMTVNFQQGTNGYSGTVDAHVRSDNATTAYGTAVTVLADNLSPLCHGLLRFENIFGSGAGQIPLGAIISSARLRLRTDNAGNDIRLHRVLVPWDNNSTWNTVGSANDGVSTSAGDAVATAELTYTTGAVGDWREIDVTASVWFWATNGGPNYGWLFVDTGDDGYQFNSSEATTVEYRPLLIVSYAPSATMTPVQVATQPAPTNTVNEGQNVTLSVSVTGTRPVFQWFKDGVAITDATNTTFTLTGVVETNAGRYYCYVTNFAPSQAQSADSWLIVNPDTNAPVLVSALGTTNLSQIIITFSKRMDGASVSNLASYIVEPAYGGNALANVSAELAANGTTVTLTTSPRTQFAYYKLTVQNLTDAAFRHNVLNPNPTSLLMGFQVGLIAPSSEWRFNQDGIDLGTAWRAANYDDSTWPNSNALFVAKNGTFGNTDLPILTRLNMSNSAPGYLTNTITYYFRSHFTMPAVADLAGLQSYQLRVRPILDDGAVFHINGHPAHNGIRMATNQPLYSTYANTSQGNDYRFEAPSSLQTTNVVFGGDNVMAVEVHQSSAGSSDAAFAAEVLINVPPLVMRVVPASLVGGNLQLTWPPVAGYRLYGADNVEGPWTPVAGNPNGSYSVPTAQAAKKFYMLRSP